MSSRDRPISRTKGRVRCAVGRMFVSDADRFNRAAVGGGLELDVEEGQ